MADTAKINSGASARALWLSTIAFTVCFAVWTIFSIIGVQIMFSAFVLHFLVWNLDVE